MNQIVVGQFFLSSEINLFFYFFFNFPLLCLNNSKVYKKTTSNSEILMREYDNVKNKSLAKRY